MNFLILFMSLILPAFSGFPSDFVFGVANAPGQVEDKLDDIWLQWARSGNIRGWKDNPERRLEFWSAPEREIELAKNLGVGSFRLGVDWGRVMPAKGKFDEAAIKRYREIFKLIKLSKMKILLTLWHHSVPKWVQDQGGWHSEETKKDFVQFSERMLKEYKDEVDLWVTFNEANVFVTMAYSVGIWPPGEKSGPLSLLALGPIRGSSIRALDHMAEAHNTVYDLAHSLKSDIKIGLAHNMAWYTGKHWIDRQKAAYVSEVMNWRFPSMTKMDFFGFNYYGAEWLKGTRVDIDPEEEYSEAGRAISVEGLAHLLREIHARYPKLPIYITENGIADALDVLRPAYLLEHLAVVESAIRSGIPVKGYYVWSLTDNLEWSDGYCPKFGLVAVDRRTLERTPRQSYSIFQKVIKENSVSSELRKFAWEKVLSHQGKERPFCRHEDGITAYDDPKPRKFSRKDWRFSSTGETSAPR